MKKLSAFILALICLMSLAACNLYQPASTDSEQETSSELIKEEQISDYLIQEDGRQYLILPVSGYKMRYDREYEKYLEQIDFDTLKTAEENLNSKIQKYKAAPCFWLQVDEDGLYLGVELIVKADPPGSGACIDHDHIMYKEKLTK